jgi:hypothetical protein
LENFIDPAIDCVFKAILSASGNENLLVNFLNNVLRYLNHSVLSTNWQNGCPTSAAFAAAVKVN